MRTIRKFYIYIFILVSTGTLIYTEGQDGNGNEDSKIKGPLVTLHEDSFADTLLVLLQSLYYNNKTLILDTHRATTTIDGVNLIIDYDAGSLSLADASLQKDSITLESATIINIKVNIPVLMVNKTYTITSAHDPDYSSKGNVILTDDGMQLILRIDTAELPYFSDSVTMVTKGTRNTTIHGIGIPIAEEIQQKIQDLVLTRYRSYDIGWVFDDLIDKMRYVFKKNELIVCLSCEISYCDCFDSI